MSDTTQRPVGFYVRYLQKLIERREASGRPPAADIAPDAYWNQRRLNKQQFEEFPRKRETTAQSELKRKKLNS